MLGNLVLDVEASSLVLGGVDGVDGMDGVGDFCLSANLFFAVRFQFLRPSMTRSAKIDSFIEEPIWTKSSVEDNCEKLD